MSNIQNSILVTDAIINRSPSRSPTRSPERYKKKQKYTSPRNYTDMDYKEEKKCKPKYIYISFAVPLFVTSIWGITTCEDNNHIWYLLLGIIMGSSINNSYDIN